MLKLIKHTTWVVLFLGATFSCVKDDAVEESTSDNFDRSSMLVHYADNFIVPAYQNYSQSLTELKASASAFTSAPDETSFEVVLADFEEAYMAWQWVSQFEIGPAERIGLRNFTNIYPTDVKGIEQAVESKKYNFTLPSTFDQQGFPALDYLLGHQESNTATIALFANNADYGEYLNALVLRLDELTTEVLDEWTSTYRDTYVGSNGSSGTASVNKTANDYVFHYEKELRAGKIGIPVGVFSGNTLSNKVEAYYTETLSKKLFMHSLEVHRKFFAGEGFTGNSSGNGFKAYLDELNIENEGKLLSDVILDQFELAKSTANKLPDNLADAVENQPQDMLSTYDELQKNVIKLKVDMMQALNIKVDYIDADGD